jgi:hypothetical protein
MADAEEEAMLYLPEVVQTGPAGGRSAEDVLKP